MPIVGAGGTKTLVFKPTGKGSASLKFALASVWINAFDPEDAANGEVLEVKQIDVTI